MNSAETTHEHGVQTHENNLSAKTCSFCLHKSGLCVRIQVLTFCKTYHKLPVMCHTTETTHEHGVQTHENNLSAKTCSFCLHKSGLCVRIQVLTFCKTYHKLPVMCHTSLDF